MIKRSILMTCLSVAIVGCDGVKEQAGLTKSAPDEFQVVRHAPLTLPPDYTLRPPRPGAPRPQEQSPDVAAAQAIFGLEDVAEETEPSAATSGENALLNQAGAKQANPDIRQTVDQETAKLFDRNKPVAEKLLGIGGDRGLSSASVVDAQAEAERLKENAKAGKPVTEGETPSIEE